MYPDVTVSLRICILLMGLCAVLPATGAEQNEPAASTAKANLNTILDGLIARARQEEAQEKNGREVVCTEHSHVEELKDDGSVKETYDVVRTPALVDGEVYMRLVSRNGAPPSGKYLDQEKDREKKFREDLKKPKKESDTDFKIDRELLNRFHVVNAGEEQLNGRPAYLLAFLPNPGDKPERMRAERVINHLGGKIWVDAQDYEVGKADVVLTEPVSFYGIVGRLRSFHLILTQRFMSRGLWAVAETDLRIDGRALFNSIRQHRVTECSDYKLRSEVR